MPVTVTSGSSITSMSGYSVFATVEAGSNNETSGAPEYRVGTSFSSFSAGRRLWSEDLSQGLDSGVLSVSLSASPGGGTNGVAWTVSGGDTVPLHFSNASYGAITQLKIVAAVQVEGATMEISNVVARFYKNGGLVETIQGQDISADTSDFSATTKESILVITPSASDNTKVVVDADVRLVLQAETINNPDDLFGRIYLYTQ